MASLDYIPDTTSDTTTSWSISLIVALVIVALIIVAGVAYGVYLLYEAVRARVTNINQTAQAILTGTTVPSTAVPLSIVYSTPVASGSASTSVVSDIPKTGVYLTVTPTGTAPQVWSTSFAGSGTSMDLVQAARTTSNNASNQLVQIETDGTMRNQGLCLDISAASTGNIPSFDTCNSSRNQHWTYGEHTDGLVRTGLNTNMCLEASPNDNVIWLQTCDSGNVNQVWQMSSR